MKRWLLPSDATSAEGLVLGHVPLPEPGPNDIRLLSARITDAHLALNESGHRGKLVLTTAAMTQ